MLRVLIALLFSISAWGLEEYRAKEQGSKLILTTPYGEKTYQGQVKLQSMRHYKVVIPLDDLKPPGEAKNEDDEDDKDEDEVAEKRATEEVKSSTQAQMGVQALPNPPAPVNEPQQVASSGGDRKPDSKTPDYDDFDLLAVRANRLYNAGRFGDAMVYVSEMTRKRPAYTRAWLMKGSLLYMMGHKDLAREAWSKAVELEPESTYIKDLMTRYK